ncbi:hypothetical protein K3495_g10522 [Podosphaera aphanis]|nr:hypothetical protein K3495_g10522 [Podosphaera aphanis]
MTGAYKSTSVRVLEHETSILPMETYLKNRKVQHGGLTRNSAVQETIEKNCRMNGQQARGKGSQGSLSMERDREESIKGPKELRKTAAFQEWASSWPHPHRNGTRKRER